MKKFLFTLFLLSLTFNLFGQIDSTQNQRSYWAFSTRVGNDILPMYNNNTPYIDYKGGFMAGLSIDKYWNWFGLGIDFDYIQNKTKSTYPTASLVDPLSNPLTNFQLTENKISRMFLGIGPNFKYQSQNNKFIAELNARAGIAKIKGGYTLLTETSYGPLNFHAGYNSNAITGKAQLKLSYFFNPNFGINLGAYYIKHYNVSELFDNTLNVATGYEEFQEIDNGIKRLEKKSMIREEPCNCDISSIGVFAGVTLRLGKKSKEKNVCNVCNEDHTPHCCATCGCSITITAKDKFTSIVLPNTDVVLTDINGNIVQSGTTNSYGVVVFKDVPEDNYVIKGKLHNVALQESTITITDFKDCKKDKASSIQKTIEYTDENFILKGNVVECNSPNGIQDVNVLLVNKLKAMQKSTLSDEKGGFIFHLNQASTYELSGKKDGYYSNKVEVSTHTYNRNNTLFIEFEMCVDPCGKAIKLDNINFDLDKAEILPQAIPDLQRVIKLMRENPTIQVEMSSHTDSQGSDAYNKNLSQKRANATVNYITSQGIARHRLIARGAGESELKNTKCANNVPCTDDEHRVNRRTEFKVICTN